MSTLRLCWPALALLLTLLHSACSQPMVPFPPAEDKRAPPVRNPYSWMAADAQQPDKREALRRPQNPYSWMATNEEPGGHWMLSRLRPFSALMAKRLGESGGGWTAPSRNPYSWTNF